MQTVDLRRQAVWDGISAADSHATDFGPRSAGLLELRARMEVTPSVTGTAGSPQRVD